jgi:hypothetical protein
MEKSVQRRFAVLATLLLAFIVVGFAVLPFLKQCCADPPMPPFGPEPLHPSLLYRLFSMDMVPRLAALAVAASATSLVALAFVYVTTAKALQSATGWGITGLLGLMRGAAASLMTGVLYLYGLFITGYFQLGFFNLLWIVGIPMMVAAFAGLDRFERRWGGLFLIIPGFVAQMILMMALGIDY